MRSASPFILLFVASLPFCPAVLAEDAAFGVSASSQNNISRTAAHIADNNVIQGINTAATVRGCGLANVEALINITANGFELIGVAWGVCLLFQLTRPMSSMQRGKKFALALLPIFAGLAIPSITSFVITSARAMNLFS